jgi:hypothetical protein
MCHSYRSLLFAAILLVGVMTDPACALFLDWRPFMVRDDLAPVQIARKTMRPSTDVLEKFTTDYNGYIGSTKGEDESRERTWSEFQFGSIRLRISRYTDPRLRSDPGQSNQVEGIWATLKSLPTQLGSSSSRETLETMGKIFTPHLDLGIEF